MTANPDSGPAADLAALLDAIDDANDRASFNVLLDLALACRLAEQMERMQAGRGPMIFAQKALAVAGAALLAIAAYDLIMRMI